MLTKNNQDMRKKRYQEKILASNSTSSGDLTSLGFNNLTIGKKYKVKLQGLLRAQESIIYIDTNHDGNTIARLGGAHQDSSSTVTSTGTLCMESSSVFIATATSISFSQSAGDSNTFVFGNGTKGHTWASLEEADDMIETTEWS